MPRPGPRPYECVRRAWHSDRHQPIRGSLIQEIFRVVSEIHSTATKKNKEWQEMLPIVVLKAEEILYSKAASETEYMNFNTLRDRLVDAINTIIRLDESTETEEFLQPCIEAALNLGCTPRRASRSQRNNNSTSYLSCRNQESPSLSPALAEKNIPYFWTLRKPESIESARLDSRFPSLVGSDNPSTPKCPAALYSHALMKNGLPLNKVSIYPLYYGSAANGISKNEASHSLDNNCDLALRLGPLSASPPCENKPLPCCVFKDVGSGSSVEQTKSSECSQHMERKLHLFPMVNADGLSEHNSETRMRKRKADFSHSLSESHLSWLPKLPSGRFIG